MQLPDLIIHAFRRRYKKRHVKNACARLKRKAHVICRACAGTAFNEFDVSAFPSRITNIHSAGHAVLSGAGPRACPDEDAIFRSFSEHEKRLATEKILEEVRGRMLEDIVLLETARAQSRSSRAFKLVLSRSEFDRVVYHDAGVKR